MIFRGVLLKDFTAFNYLLVNVTLSNTINRNGSPLKRISMALGATCETSKLCYMHRIHSHYAIRVLCTVHMFVHTRI